jgi:hypothetical protein
MISIERAGSNCDTRDLYPGDIPSDLDHDTSYPAGGIQGIHTDSTRHCLH